MALENKQKNTLTIISVLVIIAFIAISDKVLGAFPLRIFNLSAIYIILALSLNLVNGFTGLFSLGHAGFMAVGAYTCALLTMTPAQKTVNFYLVPIVPFLGNIHLPFIPSLLLGGILAGFVGFL
ncbi:MAG: branched-chain amino acid ABC transporter permease, partial [Treponema sp.]|nr:branched-chain amino acid ABC transporter permease [Treponema sp.]